MTTIAPIVENAFARNARLKREAAERSRLYRQRQKAERAPESRTSESAIVEALSFVLAKHVPLARAQRLHEPMSSASAPVLEILATATDILVHQGYSREKSRVAVADRVASRPDHKASHNVPSLCPPDDQARIMPPKLWPGDPVRPVLPFRRYGVPSATLAAYLRLDDDENA